MATTPVHFVSGHLNLSPDEFQQHYAPRLQEACDAKDGCRFVVGDCQGADAMAQEWFASRRLPKDRVAVFHMHGEPRHNVGDWPTHKGFKSDGARDAAMTAASTADLAWVRPEEETKRLLGAAYRPGRISGTAKNLLRRQQLSR